MIKHPIRLTSLVLAVLTSLLVFRYTMISQQMMPLGTVDRFELNVSKTSVPKEKLISSLSKIVDQGDNILVKVAVDPDYYQDKKDIIWFGSKEPEHRGLVIERQKISWFNSALTRELISKSDMETRPLSGMYAVKGGQVFQDELDSWAESNDLELSWETNPSFLELLYLFLFMNGIGNAVISAFLLLLTTLISWFVIHAKSRTLRLLGGVRTNRIHFEDTMTILAITVPSLFTGWVSTIGYLALRGHMAQIPLVLWQSFMALVSILALLGVFGMVFSLVVSPKINHIALRQIPLKRFNQLGTLTRFMMIVLALLIVPTTVTAAYISHQLSKDQALWQSMNKTVRLSFSDIDALETERMLPEVEKLFNRMQQQDNLRLSLVIDKAILLEQERLGGYDHIVITDHGWVNDMGIGIDNEGISGKITKIRFENLYPQLKDFLNAQLPIWVEGEEVESGGLGFYEYTGDKFLALPPNVGLANETIQAKKPLIILVNNPISLLKTKGFLIPAASSGNIVFPDEEQLHLALSDSLIKPYVVSIDGIADLTLEQAQKFSQESIYYVLACVLILITMIFASVTSAQLWAGANKKRVFTLHTFGRTYASIIKPALSKELSAATITIVVGSFVAFMVRHPKPVVLLLVALSVALLYGGGSILAYRLCTIQAFHKMSHRYY